MTEKQDIAFIGDIHLSFTIWERFRAITGDSQYASPRSLEPGDNGIEHLRPRR